MAVGELVVNIIGDMKELSKTFSSVQKELGDVGKKFNDVGKTMSNAGKTMSTYVTAPVLGLGAISLHTASNFDDAMRRVQAVSGSTGAEFEQLSRQARDLGASTSFSASDAADAMYYLALAGWKTNDIMDATPGLLSLAAAAGMELGTAADIVSDTMSAFQMEASLAGTAADIFAAASSNSNTDVSMLGEAMKYAGASANSAGMDLAQTATVLGILADSGIKGSMAGTTFTAMLRDMKKNAVDGTIVIGKQVIALYDQTGAMRSLGDIMADVEKATDGMTTKQKDAALSNIFQEQSIRGVNIMLATGSERYHELEGKIKGSDGAAKRMAETMEGGVGGAIRNMESALEELMIVLGNIIVVGVTPLIKYITDLANWFSKLPAPIQQTVVAIGAILAVIGPLLVIIGSVASGIGSLAASFGSGSALAVAFAFAKTAIAGIVTALGSFALPVALVIAAVVGLALAWKYNWLDIQGNAQAVWDWLKKQGNALYQQLERVYHAIIMSGSTLKTQFSAAWDAIKNAFSTIASMIVDLATWLYEGLKGAYALISDACSDLITDWEGKWESVKTTLTQAVEYIINNLQQWYINVQQKFNLVKDAANYLQDYWKTNWENFKTILATAVTNIINKLQEWYNGIKQKFDDVKATASELLGDWRTTWNNIISTAKDAGSQLVAAISGLPTSIKDLSSAFSNAGKAIMDDLYNSIVEGFNNAIKKAKEMLSELRGYLPSSPAETGPFKKLPDWSSAISTPLKKSVAEASSTAKSAGSSIMNSVATGVKKAASKVSNSLSSTFKKVRKYLPFSPAEFGPFSEIPDWDSVFVEPMLESIKKTGKLAVPLEAALSRVKSPVDSFSSGLGNISSISNTINNAGDTITIGPNTLASGVDIRMLIEELNKYTANKRRARGLYK